MLETIGGSAKAVTGDGRSKKDGLEVLFWKTVALGTTTQVRVGADWWRDFTSGSRELLDLPVTPETSPEQPRSAKSLKLA